MSDILNPLQPITELQLNDPPEIATGKDAFLSALRQLDIVSVQAEYNGYGDEGGVETITAVKADNSEVELKVHTCPLSEPPISMERAVEEFAWTAVQHFHCGFHNNEGGFGTLTINVDTGRVAISHDDNVIETVHSENEF